jgi:UDP-N-acetylmuramoyl-L-alanyl-D-glutamate--2,6-diaminopimelate ligase
MLEGGGFSTGMISTVDFKVGQRRWPNSTRQSTPEAPEIQGLLREMADAGCAYAVIESTSHALSARWNRLGGCDFDVAVFLNIPHEHLDYHGSFAQYRADKARLFEMLGEGEKGEAWAIANADDPSCQHFLDAAPARARRLTFGVRAEADLRAHEVSAGPGGSTLRVATPWGETRLRLQLPGSFNVSNALAALGVALSQGIPLERAAAALEAVPGIRGRMQPISMGQPFDVIVDYAHNPDSFEQVLGMLRPLTRGRIIAVFGSAGERDRAKRAVQGQIAGHYAELLVLTDEDPRGEDPAAIIAEIAEGAERSGKRSGDGYLCIPDRAEAIRTAMSAARPGDLVLLLGKGHEGNIIYAGGSIPWDEAEAARGALRALGYAGGAH